MRYKFLWVITGTFLAVISGCVSTAPKQVAIVQENFPMCYGKKDCEVKWAAARRWVLENSNRKIQIYSDDLIETYNPEKNSIFLAARITKEPVGAEGEYYIVPNVWCDNWIFGCTPKKADALMDFNNYVNSVVVNDESFYKNALKDSKYIKPIMGAALIYTSSGKVIVKKVFSGSPAEKAGIKTQDRIYRFDRNIVYKIDALLSMIEKVPFGQEVQVEVIRGSVQVQLSLKFPTKDELNTIRESDGLIDSKNFSDNFEEKIGSLSRLLKKGLLTQEEYDKKKTQLLEKY